MKILKYSKDDYRWQRVEPYKNWCIDVPNPFMQVLYLYKDKVLKIKNIIETGTYEGWTTEFFANHFNFVDTIEKFPTNNSYSNQNLNLIYQELKLKFNNINFHTGDSGDKLKEILSNNLNTQFVFLLDAHASNYSPIVEELKSIKNNSNVNNHFIIIDDGHDVGSIGWPSKDELERLIKDINNNYIIEYTNYGRGIIVIYESMFD
jgi:predicted O-methyltransferase YrrM